jgi:hypothetical protein
MSSGAALTWTAAGLLIAPSSPAFLPECRFPRQLIGDSYCDVATAAIEALWRLSLSVLTDVRGHGSGPMQILPPARDRRRSAALATAGR